MIISFISTVEYITRYYAYVQGVYVTFNFGIISNLIPKCGVLLILKQCVVYVVATGTFIWIGLMYNYIVAIVCQYNTLVLEFENINGIGRYFWRGKVEN